MPQVAASANVPAPASSGPRKAASPQAQQPTAAQTHARNRTISQPQIAVPLVKPQNANQTQNDKASKDAESGNNEAVSEADKFTPRQSTRVLASQPMPMMPPVIWPVNGSGGPQEALVAGEAAPISEENVTKIPSVPSRPLSLSMDGKSTTSGTTFPLDEKESLRPDDSASVKAAEDDDGRGSTQPSSLIGSDSGARAFSEQLREISIMGPPRQPAAIARLNASAHPPQGILYSPSPIAVPSAFTGVSPGLANEPNDLSFPPDEKLLEALNSVRDRVWVLKLEQDITDFVKDPSAQSFDLPQCNSFYRMLAHKMADYYLLGHTMDNTVATVRLWKTPNCRIPPRLSEATNPSTAASTPPPPVPQMKILRRNDSGTRPSSREGIIDGDSGSDVGKSKFPATREEREARYEAARLRILGSAKPAEDAAVPAPPKEPDGSNSNSVVGKRKTRKQRSDSEDGFEARSAYSMYPQGGQQPQGQYGPQSFPAQPQNAAGPMNQQMAYGMPMAFGGAYQPQPQAQGPQPWYNHGYPQLSQQGAMWNNGGFGQYDINAQMQAMSFNQNQSMGPYSGQMGNEMPSPQEYSSPGMMNGYGNGYPQQQMYPNQYQGAYNGQGYPTGQPYQYGMMPNQNQNGMRRPMPNQHPQAAFNRPFFNPNSQAFIPGQPGTPFNRPPHFSGPISPAASHASANASPHNPQRQLSSHSNPTTYAQSPQHQSIPPQPPSLQHHNHLIHPNPMTLTHPLPQPVFARAPPQNGAGNNGNVQPRPYPANGMSPQQNNNHYTTPPKTSGLAKYAAAGLPAKPPPPAPAAAPG